MVHRRMFKKIVAVYRIANLANGKLYIGSTCDLHSRWNSHRHRLENGTHANRHLQRAWDKYGADSFSFEILEVVSPELLTVREQYWIDISKAVRIGYNICSLAYSCSGVKRSRETRMKMSIAQKARMRGAPAPVKATEAARLANIGRKVSQATRNKIGDANRISLVGRKLSRSHRASIVAGVKLIHAERRNDPILKMIRSKFIIRHKCSGATV